jgi:hypothetical protein
MKWIESPWAFLILLVGFFSLIEVMHLTAHQNCKGDCPCQLTNEY